MKFRKLILSSMCLISVKANATALSIEDAAHVMQGSCYSMNTECQIEALVNYVKNECSNISDFRSCLKNTKNLIDGDGLMREAVRRIATKVTKCEAMPNGGLDHQVIYTCVYNDPD